MRKDTTPSRKTGSHRRPPPPELLWPVALTWYAERRRLGLFVDVNVLQRSDGSFLHLAEIGDLPLEPSEARSSRELRGPATAAALLRRGRTQTAILAGGSTSDEALEEVLRGVADAFAREVGTRRAWLITANILEDTPELVDHQFAWLVAHVFVDATRARHNPPGSPALTRAEIVSIIDTGHLAAT